MRLSLDVVALGGRLLCPLGTLGVALPYWSRFRLAVLLRFGVYDDLRADPKALLDRTEEGMRSVDLFNSDRAAGVNEDAMRSIGVLVALLPDFCIALRLLFSSEASARRAASSRSLSAGILNAFSTVPSTSPNTIGVAATVPHVTIGDSFPADRPGTICGVMLTSVSCSRRCRLARARLSTDTGSMGESKSVDASVE